MSEYTALRRWDCMAGYDGDSIHIQTKVPVGEQDYSARFADRHRVTVHVGDSFSVDGTQSDGWLSCSITVAE